MNKDFFYIRECSKNKEDQDFLFEMLYQSIFSRPGEEPCDKKIIELPDIRMYVENWGKQGDLAYIAVEKKTKISIAAIWIRLFDEKNMGYGFVDKNIPEMGIAVDRHFRGRGIGTVLMNYLINNLKGKISAVSLSVDEDNPAMKLYEKFGFKKWGAYDGSIIMILNLREQ